MTAKRPSLHSSLNTRRRALPVKSEVYIFEQTSKVLSFEISGQFPSLSSALFFFCQECVKVIQFTSTLSQVLDLKSNVMVYELITYFLIQYF